MARTLCFPGIPQDRTEDVKCVLESIGCSVAETRHIQWEDDSQYLVVLFAAQSNAARAQEIFGSHPPLSALKTAMFNKKDTESTRFQ